MMKKLLATLLGCLLMIAVGTAHAEIGVMIQLQQDEIVRDTKAGLLLPSEANTVFENLNRIKFEYKRAKSHGVMNNYETQMLTIMLRENETLIASFLQNKQK